MDVTTVLDLVKARLGINGTIRDTYLTKIVEGVISEIENEKGVTLDSTDANHLMFVVDYSTWRYTNRNSEGSMPRHLQFRMHNLIVYAQSIITE